MTTPERSIEEMKKQFREKWEGTNLQNQAISTPMMNEMFADIETILQAERQKREEMLREALEEAGNYVDELYQSGNMGENEYALLTDFFDEKLTQPNNK